MSFKPNSWVLYVCPKDCSVSTKPGKCSYSKCECDLEATKVARAKWDGTE